LSSKVAVELCFSVASLHYWWSVLDRFGFAGLIELCRFSFLTLDLAAKYGMNRLIVEGFFISRLTVLKIV
jgi:hypothetical protein